MPLMRVGTDRASVSIAMVAAAALFWGLSGGIGAILLANDWAPSVISLYRGMTGLLFVLCWLALHHRYSGLSDRMLWFWSIVAGLGVAGNFTFYFISAGEGSVAVAATLVYCAPVFVYLTSFVLKLERPTPVKWAGIVLVLIGVVLLTEVHDIGPDSFTLFGIGAGLLAAVSYTVFIFGFKHAAPRGSPQAILAVAFSAMVAVMLFISDHEQVTSVIRSRDAMLFAALGTLGAGVSFVIYVLGLKQTSPPMASIVATIEPVTASLFGVILLGESLAVLQYVGMCLILLTVTCLSVYSSAGVPPHHFGHRLRQKIALKALKRDVPLAY